MTPPDQPISKDVIYYACWALAILWGFWRLERLITLVLEIRDKLK